MTVTFQRTAVPEWQKDPDQSGWFQKYLEEQRERRAAADPAPAEGEEDEDEEEPDGAVVVAAHAMDPADMGQSARNFWKRLEAARGGWSLDAQTTTTEHAETIWKSDSKEGAKDQHEEGQVKRALHRRVHLWIKASVSAAGEMVAGFVLEYEFDEGSVKPAWKAKWFQFYDVITDERVFTKKAGEFDEWLSVFAPKPEPKTPRKKKEPVLTEAEQQEAYFQSLRNGEAEWQPES